MLAKRRPCARPPRRRKPLAPAPGAANRLERPIGRNDEALLRKAALQPRLTDTRKKALDAHLQLSIRLRVLLEDAGLAEKRLQLRGGREGGFMWQTADALSADTLLVVIPGSGSCEPGPWSTLEVCGKDGVQLASVLPYIKHATARGWGAVLLCPNQGVDAQGASIPGSASPASHCVSAWDAFLSRRAGGPGRHICIVAHSSGGPAALALVARAWATQESTRGRDGSDGTGGTAFPEDGGGVPAVTAVALLDSVHREMPRRGDTVFEAWARGAVVNFVVSAEPAGATKPKPWCAGSTVAGCRCLSGGSRDHLRVPGAARGEALAFLEGILRRASSNPTELRSPSAPAPSRCSAERPAVAVASCPEKRTGSTPGAAAPAALLVSGSENPKRAGSRHAG